MSAPAAEAPLLLLLHGFMGCGAEWAEVAAALEGAGYRCLAPPLPAGSSLAEVADGVAALLESLSISRVYAVIGYSLGGRVALHFALRHPARLERLVLESASPGIDAPSERAARAARDAALAESLERDLAGFVRGWYQLPLFQSLQRRPELLASLLERRAAGDAAALAAQLRDLSPGRQPSLWPRLVELTHPTLLLAGELDAAYLDISRRAAEGIGASARRVVVPEAGHNIHLEAPRALVAAVLAFCAL